MFSPLLCLFLPLRKSLICRPRSEANPFHHIMDGHIEVQRLLATQHMQVGGEQSCHPTVGWQQLFFARCCSDTSLRCASEVRSTLFPERGERDAARKSAGQMYLQCTVVVANLRPALKATSNQSRRKRCVPNVNIFDA